MSLQQNRLYLHIQQHIDTLKHNIKLKLDASHENQIMKSCSFNHKAITYSISTLTLIYFMPHLNLYLCKIVMSLACCTKAICIVLFATEHACPTSQWRKLKNLSENVKCLEYISKMAVNQFLS